MAKDKPAARKSSIDFLSDLTSSERPVLEISIDQIEPDTHQPRQTWHEPDGVVPDSERIALENLANDIREQGVMQPIILREIAPEKYMIVIGERRWRASKLAGNKTIPSIVRQDLSGAKVALAQLAENVQRENMSDLDTARFVKRMLDENPELQKRDLAQLLNKHPSYVSRMMAFVDPRWEHIVSTGIITFASVLEQFRSLPENTQTKLVEDSKNRGTPISALEVQEAKRTAKPSNSEPARGPLDDFGKEFAEVISSQQDKKETYTREPDAVISKTNSIKDTGSETMNKSLHEPSDVHVPAHLLDVQEVKMSVGQLAKFLETVTVEASVAVTIPLSSELIAEAIQSLGGTLPEDQSWLGKALLDILK